MNDKPYLINCLIVVFVILILIVITTFANKYLIDEKPEEENGFLDGIDHTAYVSEQYNQFEAFTTEKKSTKMKLENSIDYSLICNDIKTYYSDKMINQKETIILSDYEKEDDKIVSTIDFKIYDDYTFILEQNVLKDNENKFIYRVGKVNMTFQNFEGKIIDHISQVKQYNLQDDIDMVTTFGITYYKSDRLFFVDMSSQNYNEIKKDLFSYNFNVETEIIIEN